MLFERMPPRLLLALLLGFSSMAAGFWLKWRILLEPDPVSWYAYSANHWGYTDLMALYLQQGLDHGYLPYIQTRLEYPVILGAIQYLLASVTSGPRSYFFASSLLLALVGLAIIWIIHILNQRARLLLFAATPPLLLYAALNWDLLAIFFALLSLLLFQRKRDAWSAFFLTLGIWTKMFPALLLPWMLLLRARERDWRSAFSMGSVAIVVSLALNLPIYLKNPQGWLYFLEFHRNRFPDSGSIWHRFPEWPVNQVNEISLILVGAAVSVFTIIGLLKRRGDTEFTLVSLAFLLLVSKVSSPQYHLWLMPLLVLVPAPAWLVGLFIGVDIAYFWASFQTIYAHWMGLSGPYFPHALTIALIIISRQVTLLVILCWVIHRWLFASSLGGDHAAPTYRRQFSIGNCQG